MVPDLESANPKRKSPSKQSQRQKPQDSPYPIILLLHFLHIQNFKFPLLVQGCEKLFIVVCFAKTLQDSLSS